MRSAAAAAIVTMAILIGAAAHAAEKPVMIEIEAEAAAVIKAPLVVRQGKGASGGILALAYERTGTIWCAVGLHAGWVAFLKVGKRLLWPNGSENMAWLYGGRHVLDGVFGVAALAIVFAGFLIVTLRAMQNGRPTGVETGPLRTAQDVAAPARMGSGY